MVAGRARWAHDACVMKRPGSLLLAVAGIGAVAAVLSRVGLSRASPKYAGETEKDLDRTFGEAEELDSLLLQDDADSLFERDPASDGDAD